VRRALLAPAAVVLLAGPTALAFWSGGYFTQPRLWAAIVAWLLVLVAALAGWRILPASSAGRVAVAGLVALMGWTAASISWGPLAGPALDATERLILYLGALLAGVALLRFRAVARALEPALAFGATLVICEGLSGRLLPGLITLEKSRRAGGRLEQPLTYWNAEGALAAVALVLATRLIGDRSRPLVLRVLAAAACVPLSAGVYLSFSRGAIAAAGLGLVVLLAAAPTRSQLRGAGIALGAGVFAVVAVAVTSGVASLKGPLATREREGAIVLGVLLVLALASAVAAAWSASRERAPAEAIDPLPHARRLVAVALATGVLVVAGLVVGGLSERGNAATLSKGASRLTSVSSSRYEYWRVGVHAFLDHPVLGTGAGGFRVIWLRERRVTEGVNDVHSLELEAAAELGLVGLLALALFLAGVAGAARAGMRRHPALVAGPLAGATTWLVHASIDWDWQVPAVSLPAILMAAVLIVAAEAPDAPRTRMRSSLVASGSALPEPAVNAAGAQRRD
jgi:O-antigen ligase